MKTDRPPPQIIPALPGFWVHTPFIDPESEHPVEPGARYAVVAWMITLLPPLGGGDLLPFVEPITMDGTFADDFNRFIEQPDGSCVHSDFNAETVAEAYKNIGEDVVKERDRVARVAEAAAVPQAQTNQ